MKKIIIGFILLITLMGCESSKYITTISSNKIAKHINLDYSRKLFFIDVFINGKPTKFLVDTGASISVLDINQADYFNYICVSNGNKKITGLNGGVFEYRVKNIKVNISNGNYIPFYFKACDLSHVVKKMRMDGIKISGVLGSDFLMNSNAIINYRNKTLDLYQF